MDIESSALLVSKNQHIVLFLIYFQLDQISTTSDGPLYSYFLDNTKTVNHQYALFGIRELSSTEFSTYCLNNTASTVPITDATVNFTSNYYIRAYTSACYYLDQNSYWQTNQLVVSYPISIKLFYHLSILGWYTNKS
jgi:hypothetical protein